MIEENTELYAGQGLRGPLWTVAGTAIGGLVVGALGALTKGLSGNGGGTSKDMQIADLRAQNFTLMQVGPLQAAFAAQTATIGYLQRTVDAVIRPMVPMPNVAGPAFPPPPYPFPPFPAPAASGGTSGGGTAATTNG